MLEPKYKIGETVFFFPMTHEYLEDKIYSAKIISINFDEAWQINHYELGFKHLKKTNFLRPESSIFESEELAIKVRIKDLIEELRLWACQNGKWGRARQVELLEILLRKMINL